MTVQPSGRRSSASCWFVLAGVIHAAVTLYWALGERGLLWTMGDSFVAQFADIMWVLYPVALVKGVSAVAPLWLARRGWPLRRLTRPVCWVGSVVLVAWGGANTVLANAVLLGAVRPDGGFDRAAMIGHAWIWDPLFLVWGASLAAGLWSTRHSEASRRSEAGASARKVRHVPGLP